MVPHIDTQTSSSLHGETSSVVPPNTNYYSYDIPLDTTIDIETQSIGNPMDSGSIQGPQSIPDYVTPPWSNMHRPNLHVGCQKNFDPPSLEVKEQKKISLPAFNPQKMSWQNFSMKLHAALIDRNMEYLLTEPATNCHNYAHSKELMLELYKKLQGSALDLFSSLNAQHYYLRGGRGIEMIKALVDKFHPLDNGAIQSIMSSLQSLELQDNKDLSTYKIKWIT